MLSLLGALVLCGTDRVLDPDGILVTRTSRVVHRAAAPA